MRHQSAIATLEFALKSIEEKIDAHPLASQRVRDAMAIIEERSDLDKDSLARELHDRGLPSPKEVRKIQFTGIFSWSRLQAKRNALMLKRDELRGN